MKILLLGDYSNVHATLAEGLRTLGHQVTVASDGDHWKDYPRDVNLQRKLTRWGTFCFLLRLLWAVLWMRGYDVVQIINPVFVELKAERIPWLYRYLRRHNKKVVMGAFGMDYYWVAVNDEQQILRYSDFNLGQHRRTDEAAEVHRREWIDTPKQMLNEMVAADCDGIVAGLYEYKATYDAVPELAHKTTFIPFPIKPLDPPPTITTSSDKLRIFVGISPGRAAYKGTDIMLRAAREVERLFPERVEVRIAQGVPFAEYQNMMNTSDVILDQLYAYTPAMNALLAMSKGVVVMGGGEPENYDIINEDELRPIINVAPTYESCLLALLEFALHPERLAERKRQSVEYIERHHHYVKVAQRYVDYYKTL